MRRCGSSYTVLVPIVFLAVEIVYNAPQLIPDRILVSGGNKIQKTHSGLRHSSGEWCAKKSILCINMHNLYMHWCIITEWMHLGRNKEWMHLGRNNEVGICEKVWNNVCKLQPVNTTYGWYVKSDITTWYRPCLNSHFSGCMQTFCGMIEWMNLWRKKWSWNMWKGVK